MLGKFAACQALRCVAARATRKGSCAISQKRALVALTNFCAAACFLVTASALASGPNWSTLDPLFTINLKSSIQSDGPVLTSSFGFVDDSTIAVAYVLHRRKQPTLQRRGELGASSPYEMRVVLLDANTGRTRREVTWPENTIYFRLMPVSDSKLLLLHDSSLTLYDRDLKEVKQITLPATMTDWRWVRPFVSPTGESILLTTFGKGTVSPWLWIDAKTFNVLHQGNVTWNVATTAQLSISDDSIAVSQCLPPGSLLPCDVIVQPVGQGSTLTLSGAGSGSQFVSDDLLFLHDWALSGVDRVVSLRNRAVLFRRDVGSVGQTYGPACSAASGMRFVVPDYVGRGGIPGRKGPLPTRTSSTAPERNCTLWLFVAT